jgi:hypothetical protein
MAQFVARCLYGPILYEFGHLGIKHARGLIGVLGKVWMMSCITLNANTPALLRHAEHEGPAILRVQVCVGQHKQTLVLLQLHVIFQILKNLTCVKLLHACITSNARLYDAFPFELREILLNVLKGRRLLSWTVTTILRVILLLFTFNSQNCHACEENFEDSIHIIHKHFLK